MLHETRHPPWLLAVAALLYRPQQPGLYGQGRAGSDLRVLRQFAVARMQQVRVIGVIGGRGIPLWCMQSQGRAMRAVMCPSAFRCLPCDRQTHVAVP